LYDPGHGAAVSHNESAFARFQAGPHLLHQFVEQFRLNDYGLHVKNLRDRHGGLLCANRFASEDPGDVTIAQQLTERGGLAPAFRRE